MDSYRQLDGNEIEHEDVFAPRDYEMDRTSHWKRQEGRECLICVIRT